jgi:hypothetical protein
LLCLLLLLHGCPVQVGFLLGDLSESLRASCPGYRHESHDNRVQTRPRSVSAQRRHKRRPPPRKRRGRLRLLRRRKFGGFSTVETTKFKFLNANFEARMNRILRFTLSITGLRA